MKKNFSISGLPRCGSHFLAEMFDKSKQWTVMPEIRPGLDFGKTRLSMSEKEWGEKVNKRYQKDYYGECTPQHLPIWHMINVAKKVCIYRHPYDYWISTINRQNIYKDKKFNWMFKTHYVRFYKIVDHIIENEPEIMVVRFEDMVKSKELVMKIAKFVGITDLTSDDIEMNNKVNNSDSHKQKNKWKDLSCLDEERFEKIKYNDWFCKKYYGDSIEKRHEKYAK